MVPLSEGYIVEHKSRPMAEIVHDIKKAHLHALMGPGSQYVDSHPLLRKLAALKEQLRAHVDTYDGSPEWHEENLRIGQEMAAVQTQINGLGTV